MNKDIQGSFTVALVFPRDSEAIFNKNSTQTFGGATVQLYSIAKQLSRYQNLKTFSIIANYKTIDFEESEAFNLVKTFDLRDSLIKKIYNFHKKIRVIKPDYIIQRGLSKFTYLLPLYCKIFGIKLVYMLASDVESSGRYQRSGRRSFLFKWLVRFSYLIISQNKFQKEQLLKKYKKNSEVLYSGFEIYPAPSTKTNLVLWVGRCDAMKRPNTFIELARKNPDYSFIMICPAGKDREFYKKILQMANSVKNLKFINFLPFNQTDAYFGRAKILVNTSDYEGFPQTFIQAAKNATPILSLNVDPQGFIASHNCGYVTHGDLNQLNKKIQLILKDEVLFDVLSKNAYLYARQNHDITTNVRRLMTILKIPLE